MPKPLGGRVGGEAGSEVWVGGEVDDEEVDDEEVDEEEVDDEEVEVGGRKTGKLNAGTL